jgi:hypothetical protein
MSRHLDGSPKPVDYIWHRRTWWLRLTCTCGRAALLPIGQTARLAGLPETARLYQLIDRLRCADCGGRPTRVEVGPASRGFFWG